MQVINSDVLVWQRLEIYGCSKQVCGPKFWRPRLRSLQALGLEGGALGDGESGGEDIKTFSKMYKAVKMEKDQEREVHRWLQVAFALCFLWIYNVLSTRARCLRMIKRKQSALWIVI
jgi:hypothetical protein